ncbi:hypothetical protein [Nocardia farcinica]|uniref:hypothetical protein n=1 Tax=Nocardia farcinica TaxID=37329 RepID=UPI001E3B4F84|nr:hypothetical protein [Nocardia farcinica]
MVEGVGDAFAAGLGRLVAGFASRDRRSAAAAAAAGAASLLPELPVPGAAETLAAPASVIAAAMVMVAVAALIARCPILFVTNMFASQLIDRIRRTQSWQRPEGAGFRRSSDNGRSWWWD